MKLTEKDKKKLLEWSLPSRERGLKLKKDNAPVLPLTVAPFAGAWIEIVKDLNCWVRNGSRSLRGSVD